MTITSICAHTAMALMDAVGDIEATALRVSALQEHDPSLTFTVRELREAELGETLMDYRSNNGSLRLRAELLTTLAPICDDVWDRLTDDERDSGYAFDFDLCPLAVRLWYGKEPAAGALFNQVLLNAVRADMAAQEAARAAKATEDARKAARAAEDAARTTAIEALRAAEEALALARRKVAELTPA